MDVSPLAQLGLHVIAKPIGPVCNLRCSYCFYLEKERLYANDEEWRMSDATLEEYVRQYIQAQPENVDEIDFAFQGGEPTLMGLDLFSRVIELQKKYSPDHLRIHNSLQTNGILLDDQWCEFLHKHDFLVGLSIDGPINLHDKYRRDRQDRGTFDRVAAAMRRLVRHGVQFNTMTCVNRHNADHPHRVYTFLRDAGATFMQFIPIVERLPDGEDTGPESMVGPTSVLPGQFGRFLTGVFDTWVQSDIGRVFVRDFDHALAAWMDVPASLCVYARTCGRAVAIEHNGDLYSCDHFVDPRHKLGNIHEKSIAELANSAFQQKFGEDKSAALPPCCLKCDYLFACNGACPKDRFIPAPDGSEGLNYLCEGFKMFFSHVEPYIKAMAGELKAGRPAAGVMQQLRAYKQQAVEDATADGKTPRRNSPCPCGSGKKFKNCCMRK